MFILLSMYPIEKPGRLTDDELGLVRQHPVIAERILSVPEVLHETLPVIMHHHEAFNGSGYPDGLKGEAIPLGARIINLVDGYDAMPSPRSHRSAFAADAALAEIEKNAGSQFDPGLVKTFVALINETKGAGREPKAAAAGSASGTGGDIIMDIIKKLKEDKLDLPVLPKIVEESKRVIDDPNSSMDALVAVIEKDAVMSVRLVSVANSPLYRGADTLHTVRQAVPRLGMKEAQALITAIACKSIFKTRHPKFMMLMEKLWMHSLACGYSARLFAAKLALPDPESCFMMGLMHDIGKIVLLSALAERYADKDSFSMTGIMSNIQESYISFSKILLLRGKFPIEFVKAAANHDCATFDGKTPQEVLLINLADQLTAVIGYNIVGARTQELAELDSAGRLGVDAAMIAAVGEEVQQIIQDTSTAF